MDLSRLVLLCTYITTPLNFAPIQPTRPTMHLYNYPTKLLAYYAPIQLPY